MSQAVVIDAVRTPVGRAHPEKGIYRDRRSDEISAELMRALVERTGIREALIEDIHWGCVKQQQEQDFDVAKMAALIADLPVEVAGASVSRNCGSGLQAIHQAAQSIAANCEDVQIAGGVEHLGHISMLASFVPSPLIFHKHSPAVFNMGLTAENLAQLYGISRRQQDEFALRSHQRAAQATDSGAFAREIIPTWGRDEAGRRRQMTEDQSIRRDTSLEALTALKPSFMPTGTVTAGNSSPFNDGAAALLIMSEERAAELGLKPMARIKAMAVAGVDPAVMGIGPVPATHKAIRRAALKIEDIDLIEINEAFAAQTLAVIKLLGLDAEKVNVRGGAIAIGHPLGASGARIATTLLHTMRDNGARYGLATMCIGGGQGIATIFEAA